MSTANATPHTAVQQLIEQRLDTIDQALLGLLPRQDRLVAVAQVETRIHELAAANVAFAANLHAPAKGLILSDSALSSPARQTPAFGQQPQFFGMAAGGWIPAMQKRRSRLAISAGVLGILALALLLATPVTYFTVEMLSEALGEIVAIGIRGAHAVALAFAGVAAVGLGIAALVSLRRHREHLVGHCWAIAGLCTGPFPILVGCAALLLVGLQLCVGELFTMSESQVASSPKAPGAPDETDDLTGPARVTTRNYRSLFEATDETGDETGRARVGKYVPPTLAQIPQTGCSQPPIQPAGHEARAATTQPTAVEASGVVPTPCTRPPIDIDRPQPRKVGVHDIITVIIDEKSEVTQNSKFNTQLRSMGQGLSQEGMKYSIAATVIDILPNGTLILEAHKSIRSNTELWEYSLTGRIRSQDVVENNTVNSENIADLMISKRETGKIYDNTKRGFINRFYNCFLPF